MKTILKIFLSAFAAIAFLSSCSGNKNVCKTNCNSGNANLTITMYDTPPTGVTVLSFTLPIVGISLTPTTGSPQAVTTLVSSLEVTRLQTDSQLLASAAPVPAGSYTAINITIGPTTATANAFINSSTSTITYGTSTCVAGAVCRLPVGAVFTVSIPLSLTLTANQNQWIGLDFNLNNAITSSGGISVDFSQANVLKATTTARPNTPSGAVDTLDNFAGKVTAYTSDSTISVQSAINGVTTATAAITSATTYDDPQGRCSAAASIKLCIKTGAIVSVQGIVTTTGTLTATEIDVIDSDLTATDEVEGIVYPSLCNGAGSFGMILADTTVTSGNATLAGLSYGAGLCITPATTATYVVDSGPLFTAINVPTTGFQSGADIVPGQVIRAQVSNVAAASVVTATATRLILRWSRLSGTVNTVSGNAFTVNGLPAYLNLLTAPQAGTYPSNTMFDGITDVTGLSGLTKTVSFRALYLNPARAANPVLLADKVRVLP
jgi:hypothetical protein